jgi:hypothetical protein
MDEEAPKKNKKHHGKPLGHHLVHEPTGQREALQKKRTLALRYRMAGLTLHQIAARIRDDTGDSCSHTTAAKYLKHSLDELKLERLSLAEDYSSLQLERLHRLLTILTSQVERRNKKIIEMRPAEQMKQLIDEQIDHLKTALTDDDIERARERLKRIVFEPVGEKDDEYEGSARHLAAMTTYLGVIDRINSLLGLEAPKGTTPDPRALDPASDVLVIRVNGNADEDEHFRKSLAASNSEAITVDR